MRRSYRSIPILILLSTTLLLVASCKDGNNPNMKQTKAERFPKKDLNPIDRYGDLLVDVQMQEVFPDGKTFVDCVPKYATDSILTAYREQKSRAGFDLRAFVLENFELPVSPTSTYETDTTRTASEHIRALWPFLTRGADEVVPGSRIALPNSYIVPGGRFREVYYWDSFFILLGLKDSGENELIENIVDNFAYQIHALGFIPNGNRTYYLSRSQPPFFAEMVKLLAAVKEEKEVYLKYVGALEEEYEFWMEGAEGLSSGTSQARVVRMRDGQLLNRFWSDTSTPRAESYREDVTTAKEATGRDPEDVYLNICAACESGWDFSSRWFDDPDNIGTIKTTHIVPVDLNALMYNLELSLARAKVLQGDQEEADRFIEAAAARKKAIDTYLWDSKMGAYQDYDLDTSAFTGTLSLAMVYPLYFEVASKEQAKRVAKTLRDEFLHNGGLVTTRNDNKEQWDYPNGWPPHQWLAVRGLENYGQNKLASKIKGNWLALNDQVYKRTGKMLEKYNVVDTTLVAGGGEYENQDGFGWTNGVYLDLKKD